jgi:hypothetical protein
MTMSKNNDPLVLLKDLDILLNSFKDHDQNSKKKEEEHKDHMDILSKRQKARNIYELDYQ